MDGAAVFGDTAGNDIGAAQIYPNNVAHAVAGDGGRTTDRE
jgi:hypothetical protein